jgi:ribonuclease HI
MAAPTEAHWKAAKGVLRYLASTTTYGIIFGESGLTLEAYCDADYAGDIDTRRSTTAYVFTLGGGAISWSSRLQPTVAASTTEAEYMAAAYAIKEALWLRTLLSELGLDSEPITIYADSQSAIKLLKNPVLSMRSKHIDVIYHFARERVARKDVSFSYIRTDDMVAVYRLSRHQSSRLAATPLLLVASCRWPRATSRAGPPTPPLGLPEPRCVIRRRSSRGGRSFGTLGRRQLARAPCPRSGALPAPTTPPCRPAQTLRRRATAC